MQKFDLDTFAGRLGWAIARRPTNGRRRGNNDFLRAMEQHAEETGKKIRGLTVGSLAAYLDGRHEPSIAFANAAAHVCGIRFEWLARKEGEPTERGETSKQTYASAPEHGPPERPRASTQSLGNWSIRLSAPVHNHVLVERWFAPPPGVRSRLPDDLWRAALSPLRELHVDANELTEDEYLDFVYSMVPPLMVLGRMYKRLRDAATEEAEHETKKSRAAVREARVKSRKRT